MVALVNQQSFNENIYDASAFTNSSQLIFQNFDTSSTGFFQSNVNINQIEDYTDWIQFGQYTLTNFFTFTVGIISPANLNNYPNSYRINGFDVAFNQNLNFYEREIYAILQFMGDVGGFLGFLQLIGSMFFSWYSSENAALFMVTQLFLRSTDESKK